MMPARHLRRHQLVDLGGEIVERLHAEREAHPLDRAEDVAGDRDVEAGRPLEQQRGAAARRLAGPIGDRGDLEVGAHRFGDAREQLALVEVGEKVVEVRVHVDASARSHEDTKDTIPELSWSSCFVLRGRWLVAHFIGYLRAPAPARGGRPRRSPAARAATRTASTKSASSRLSGSSLATVDLAALNRRHRRRRCLTSRHISTFCAA